MARLVELNWHPSDRQLRQFGLIAAVALPSLGWFWTARFDATALMAAAGMVLAALGVWRPRSLRVIFVGLGLVTYPIGWLVSELSLLCLFYGVFVPLGLAFRWAGRDPLQRKFDPEASSYWQPKKPSAGAASYFRRW